MHRRKLNHRLAAATLLALFPPSAHAITFDHPAETAVTPVRIAAAPAAVKELGLSLPGGCAPVYVERGVLREAGSGASSPAKPDAAVICRSGTGAPVYRLLVFFAQSDATYRQVATSDTLIAVDEEGGEAAEHPPFMGVPSIKDRVLTIRYENSGTSCLDQFTQKWRWSNPGGFKLIGYTATETCDHEVTEGGETSHESVSHVSDVNVRTGRRLEDGREACRLPGAMAAVPGFAAMLPADGSVDALSCPKAPRKPRPGRGAKPSREG